MARIVRDATLLGIGPLDPEACRAALVADARCTFPDREGIIRLEARAAPGGAPRLVARARELGPEPACWRAALAREAHPGPSAWSAAKTSERALYERALAEVPGADEVLLADAGGFLVEGARTSLAVVLASGALVTPPLARGAQAGIGRAILLARTPELVEADVTIAALATARELVAVNAVRGARPVVTLGGQPVGAGVPGPWSERLADAFRAG